MVLWRPRDEFHEDESMSCGKHKLVVRWELKKKCAFWIFQMEMIVDLVGARGVCEMKTVCEDRPSKKFGKGRIFGGM